MNGDQVCQSSGILNGSDILVGKHQDCSNRKARCTDCQKHSAAEGLKRGAGQHRRNRDHSLRADAQETAHFAEFVFFHAGLKGNPGNKKSGRSRPNEKLPLIISAGKQVVSIDHLCQNTCMSAGCQAFG